MALRFVRLSFMMAFMSWTILLILLVLSLTVLPGLSILFLLWIVLVGNLILLEIILLIGCALRNLLRRIVVSFLFVHWRSPSVKTKAYAVFDSKAGFFAPPFFMQATGLAIRAFTDLSNDPKSNVSRYPADFALYEIGEYDDATAAFTSIKPLNLGLASAYVRVVKSPMEVK